METQKQPLRVGAGRGVIRFTPDILPHSKRETYTRVLDQPCVRIVLLDSEERYLLIASELANMDREVQSAIIQMLMNQAETPEDHIIFHLNHVHSTPHGWGPFDKEDMPDSEREKMEPFYQAILNAAQEALSGALRTLRPAQAGVGHGICGSTIVNRNVRTKDGWWLGADEAGEKDETIGIVRFDDLEDNTIAILYIYNVVPSIFDYSTRDFEPGLERTVSADLAGYASAYVEAEFPGAVAVYLTGAAGDVWPSYSAMYNLVGRNGTLRTMDLGDEAFVLARIQGERLGQQVVIAADEMVCRPLSGEISIRFGSFSYEGKDENGQVHEMGPVQSCEYIPCGTERSMEIPYFMIGSDVCLIGLHCQIGVRSIKEIQRSSPCAVTGVLSFTTVGGQDKGGPNGIRKYIPEREGYEKAQYMAQNSVVMPGAAEALRNEIITYLNQHR